MRGTIHFKFTRRSARRPQPRRGTVLVLTAILMVVLLGMMALAFDFGYLYWTGQKLQNAADSAAMAGAGRLQESHAAARQAAVELAAASFAAGASVQLDENDGNNGDGDVVLGFFDTETNIFTPTTVSANAVKVVARRTEGSVGGPVATIFGQVLGVTQVEVARKAIAIATGPQDFPAIIALNDRDPQSFYVFGHATLDVFDNTVQVNSSSDRAAVLQGTNISMNADEVNIVGRYQERGNPGLPTMNEGEPYMSDPLAGLPEPEVGDPMYPPQISGSTTFDPGYYPQGLNLNAGDNVFLNPGIYVLDNGFRINGHANLTGHGVIIFIRTGQLHENGSGRVYLTPMTEGIYAGITFFQSRSNTTTAVFNGNGMITGTGPDDTIGTGMMYFPSATLEISGDGVMYVDKLIADKVIVSGNGTTNVTDGYGGPQGIGGHVYLVY